jgi:hypothetical protein
MASRFGAFLGSYLRSVGLQVLVEVFAHRWLNPGKIALADVFPH